MIAMEMGAPDPIDDDEFVEPEVEQAHPSRIAAPMVEEARIAEPIVEEAHIVEPPPVEPEIVAEVPEPMVRAGRAAGSTTASAGCRSRAGTGAGSLARLVDHRQRHRAQTCRGQ